MNSNITQIILVDDHDLFRDGIKTLLELNNIGKVIAEASNGIEFLDLLKTHKPDLVLMDIDMPLMNGIQATKESLELFPELKILVLSMYGDEQYYYQMIEAGAQGFILKTANKGELIEAISTVKNGANFYSLELLNDIVEKMGVTKANEHKSVIKFNDKEIEILKHMQQGLSTEEIAKSVYLSAKTVSNYRTLMLERTSCKNSISLVIYAIKNNIIKI